MQKQIFINEVLSSSLLCHHSGIQTAKSALENAQSSKENHTKLTIDKVMASYKGETCLASLTEAEGNNPYDMFQENSIALIPIRGLMTKYGTWWSYGVDDMVEYIKLADKSSKICAIVIVFDTPGGTNTSLFKFINVIPTLTKTTCAFIDGMCCSAGIYCASYCDMIYASHPMCEAGSIGAMGKLVNTRKADEKYGIEIIEMYPKESQDKNKAVRDALAGDTSLYEEEMLSPLAIDFQEAIKKNRPNLNTTTEGILTGKDFYASKCVEIGLIDAVKSLDQVIKELSTNNSLINDIKNSITQ